MTGRTKETKELNDLYDSGKAELVAIYGRRRVGKTFLVNELFADRMTFRHAGLSPADDEAMSSKKQLNHFYHSLLLHGMKKSRCPADWLEAFFMLEKLLMEMDDGSRQLVFFDELPWLDTPKSGFMTAFEGFWNTWGCCRKNLMVVVCGSASSWVLDKLVNNHGGLYGRVTYEIKLSPFTLKECEEYFLSRNVILSRYDVVQCAMCLGGIPYYLGYVKGTLSLEQNIDGLFFGTDAKLKGEYDRLFASVFSNPEQMKEIIEFVSKKNAGFYRNEIAEGLKKSEGGLLTKNLGALIESGFVEKYYPFGEGRKMARYRLADPFCIFYIHFVKNSERLSQAFWKSGGRSPAISSWRGFAFENICFGHIKQIKDALGITGVYTTQSSWSIKGDGESRGMQVDMIIDRDDNIVNLCEIKFYGDSFTVDKGYYMTMMERRTALEGLVPRKKAVRNVLITTMGLKKNEYASVFSNVLTLDELFK